MYFKDIVSVVQPTKCCTYFKMLKDRGAFKVLPVFTALPESFKALRLVQVLWSHCRGCVEHKGVAVFNSVLSKLSS